jgi:tetratricopeptide (TPR) repeat protein
VRRLASIVLGFALIGACHEKQEVTPPPPPLRPEPEPLPPKASTEKQKDCDELDPKSEGKPISFDERSIPESTKLAEGAKAKLDTDESAEVERSLREQYITEAVTDFITALKADPYNVTATYHLAKAYARIGRKQCAMNLLTRLLQMRPHPAKRPDVEAHLDMLLGRKMALDPDFSEMRRDERFRDLIKKMCDGTNDPNCVYGAQRDNRER